jgi:hypothetical protein
MWRLNPFDSRMYDSFVLNASQIGNLYLLCAIKTIYPNTRIIAQTPLQIDAGADFR